MIFETKGSRFERQSRARARRIARRLEEVQRTRGTRSAPRSLREQLANQGRGRSRLGPVGLFAVSLLFGTLLASTVTATVLQWWNDEPAVVRSIAVQGIVRLAGEEVARATGVQPGSALGGLSEGALAAQVTSHPWIREARVALLPTGTLIVDVTERVARAVLRDDSGAHFVDAEGIAFAAVGPEDGREAASLPLLVGDPGDAATLRQGLEIASAVAELPLPGFAVPGDPHRGLALRLPLDSSPREGWILLGGEGPEVVLGDDDLASITDRLDRLERLLQADLQELEETAAIDLRFAGQAVLRRKSASG